MSGENGRLADGDGQESATPVGGNQSRLPEWLSQEKSLRIRLPDLSAFGYRLVSRSNLEIDGTQTLRLDYQDDKGRAFNLFLRPRWNYADTDIRVTQEDGIAFASWLDGPLSSAIATQLPKPEALAIATMIRRALHESMQDDAVTGRDTRQPSAPRPPRPQDGASRNGLPETAPVVPASEADRQTSVHRPSGRATPARMATAPGPSPNDP